MSWEHYRFFEHSAPRAAKGGIKAQSKQGKFGANWWAQRWIQVLESFQIGARLQRGRSYARRGQVLNIDIQTGLIKAKVQGSRPKPYNVEIHVRTLSAKDTERLGQVLAQQALFAAKLLAGEMPQDIEQAFTGAKLSLFPQALKDLETDCSCPDWSNPCKHIAAVYYLVGEEFDRDPFLIFKLRGVDREKLIELLGEQAAPADSAVATATAAPATGAAEPTPGEPLDPALPQFWRGADLPDGWLGEVSAPPLTAALPKRLGNFPFWRANERFLDALSPLYAQTSARAQTLLLGERPEGK
ncbi:MAG TPA: SWIM zinc finger family protein [Bacillota bacterium]|nr:SWIM zinc finger family protein [Bacillota bacterium]